MPVSTIKADIPCNVHTVWETVTDVESYPVWRTDLSKTEILNAKQFVEHTKDGFPTTFTVTCIEPYKRWEFDMENSNMCGHWVGIFTLKGTHTQIEFIETVTAKKVLLKPFVKLYLRKQQARFVADLQKVLAQTAR